MHKTKNSEKTTKNGTNKPKNKEEDEVGKKLSAYNKEFKRLVKLVENEQNQSKQAIEELSDDEISTETLTKLVDKRKKRSASKDDFIVNLRLIDIEKWILWDGKDDFENELLVSFFSSG